MVMMRSNPRKKKNWTYEQAESRKDKAERFTRDVLEDDARADELAEMSVEDYAEERGRELVDGSDSEQGDDSMIKRKNGTKSGVLATPKVLQNSALELAKTLKEELDDAKDELRDRDSMLDAIVDMEDDDPAYTPQAKLDDINAVFPDDDEGED